jgi:tyrosyl-DNA phosphodiesterase-1
MFLVGYSSGRLRVNIHTSNLLENDVHLKCQGAFIQDFLPKTDDQLSSFESSDFEESLVTYMESYHILKKMKWSSIDHMAELCTLVSHLQKYDFSTAVGVLIPSIPGYHEPHVEKRPGKEVLGYLKVQQAIRKHCSARNSSIDTAGPIVCQFSSIGSLSIPYLDKVMNAWNVRTAHQTGVPPRGTCLSLLKIVWPTVQEIVTSVEGPSGGGSVPGRTRCLQKDFLKPLLHRWKATSVRNCLEKGVNVPHIKTYYQNSTGNSSGDDGNDNSMDWFVVSSHNLSKAAWGELQNRSGRGPSLAIQHWELGVFISPSTLGVDSMGPFVDDFDRAMSKFDSGGRKELDGSGIHGSRRAIIPLPYKFRPERYQTNDEPWAVDLPRFF